MTTPYVVAHAKMPDVSAETHAQVDKAIAAGIHLSHLDTHMGTIVSTDDLTAVYLATGQSYKLPVLLSRKEDRLTIDLSNSTPCSECHHPRWFASG